MFFALSEAEQKNAMAKAAAWDVPLEFYFTDGQEPIDAVEQLARDVAPAILAGEAIGLELGRYGTWDSSTVVGSTAEELVVSATCNLDEPVTPEARDLLLQAVAHALAGDFVASRRGVNAYARALGWEPYFGDDQPSSLT